MGTKFKVGDKVKIAHSKLVLPELWDEEGEVVVIWPYPNQGVQVMLPSHKVLGYPPIYHWGFGCHNLDEKLILLGQASTTAKQDKPCQVCSKPNDADVKSCWWCGNLPFSI